MTYTTFVGIDISARNAHVALIADDGQIQKPFVIAQTPEGMAHLKQTLLRAEANPSNTLVKVPSLHGFLRQ